MEGHTDIDTTMEDHTLYTDIETTVECHTDIDKDHTDTDTTVECHIDIDTTVGGSYDIDIIVEGILYCAVLM